MARSVEEIRREIEQAKRNLAREEAQYGTDRNHPRIGQSILRKCPAVGARTERSRRLSNLAGNLLRLQCGEMMVHHACWTCQLAGKVRVLLSR